jgi:lysine-N-methylase
MDREIERCVPELGTVVDDVSGRQFARVRLTPEGNCPFLNEERLCRIQAELGEEQLSITCATYPRILHRIDDEVEMTLSLSCPEAARLVLLSPGLLGEGELEAQEWPATPKPSGVEREPRRGPMLGYFWPIRAFVHWLLARRQYALWQRLFLIGVFVRRMDAFARGDIDRPFEDILHDFAAAVTQGTLRSSMETIEPNRAAQLDMVLRLAGLRLERSFVGQRFVETVESFKAGIGYASGATLDTLVEGFGEAHDRWYAPFVADHPAILENFLINLVFRRLFPYGQEGGRIPELPAMAREFSLLAMQFALMQGLLIGVAGCHREAFSERQVVLTVQATSKHFEHHPEFLDKALSLLRAGGMDDLRGLTMMVHGG